MIELNWTILIQMVNFLILIFVLNKILYKPVLKVLEERDEKIYGGQQKIKDLEEETRQMLIASQKGEAKTMVGFNRRFSPAAAQARKHFGTAPGPLTMLYRINAGFIPRNHWTQDPIEGGGRILGEVCHFIDLMQFMCGADPVAVSAMCIDSTNTAAVPEDHVVINLKFADGSVGSIGYFASGAPSMPKEQLEILGAGRSAVIHNFQKITLYGAGKTRHIRCGSKGHKEEVLAFLDGIKRGIAPISLISQLATTLATMRIRDALAHGRIERVDLAELADHDT